MARRIADYNYVVGSLFFPPLPAPPSSSRETSTARTTIYDTSHLFFFGDLNFRLNLPETHCLCGPHNHDALVSALDSEGKREELKEYDELRVEREKGTVFMGLKEGDFWKFKVRFFRPTLWAVDPRKIHQHLALAVHIQVWDWRG